MVKNNGDEQIEQIARAMAEDRSLRHYGLMDDAWAADTDYGRREWLAAARAAHSVMAGTIAELQGTVHNAWLQWKAGEWSAEDALTALFDQIVCPPLDAALAPPRRHD